jgi:chemotaxis response regulator CheB
LSPAPIAAETETAVDAVGAEPAVPQWLNFPIVGVAASAGGLEAFSQLLGALPSDSGIALVFVLHLAPHRDSMLAELLRSQAHIPVMQITDGMKIEPDHVYVTPECADRHR